MNIQLRRLRKVIKMIIKDTCKRYLVMTKEEHRFLLNQMLISPNAKLLECQLYFKTNETGSYESKNYIELEVKVIE